MEKRTLKAIEDATMPFPRASGNSGGDGNAVSPAVNHWQGHNLTDSQDEMKELTAEIAEIDFVKGIMMAFRIDRLSPNHKEKTSDKTEKSWRLPPKSVNRRTPKSSETTSRG
jgi:hypothetical protein